MLRYNASTQAKLSSITSSSRYYLITVWSRIKKPTGNWKELTFRLFPNTKSTLLPLQQLRWPHFQNNWKTLLRAFLIVWVTDNTCTESVAWLWFLTGICRACRASIVCCLTLLCLKCYAFTREYFHSFARHNTLFLCTLISWQQNNYTWKRDMNLWLLDQQCVWLHWFFLTSTTTVGRLTRFTRLCRYYLLWTWNG